MEVDHSRTSHLNSAEEPEDLIADEPDALLPPLNARSNDSTPSRRRLLLVYALPAMLLCMLVISFDSSYVIGNYSRRIASDLHEFENARWLVLGFLVTESACGPLYGHAVQVYGHTSAILFAAAAVSIGLFLCFLSHNLWEVALSRVVVGTGASGVQFLVVVIINDLVQIYELPLWTSATVFCSTIGLMLGGPLGAALTDRMGFRWTFGIESVAMMLTSAVLYLTLHLPETKSEHGATRIEFPSAALLLTAVSVPLFALNLGGEIFAWAHPVIISMFCLTPVLIYSFYLVDTRLAQTPILPQRFIHNRDVAITLACVLPMKFVFDQLRFSFGTYLEARCFDRETVFSDWALTCIYFGRCLGSILSGILIKRYRTFRIFLRINIILDLIIYFSFAVGWMHPEVPTFAPVLVLIGATEGFAEGIWLVALLSLVDTKDQPTFYAFFNLLMGISGDLGIAISLAAEGTLVKMKLHSRLDEYPNVDEMIRKILEDLENIRQLETEAQRVILDALISSTEAAFGISFLALLVSLVFSFYVKETFFSRSASYIS